MAGYESLIRLDVLHTYYKSGRSADLVYMPVADTKQLLRNQRMLFKELGGGFGILFENYGEGIPKVRIDEDLEFVFGIGLKNPSHFLGVTQLDEKSPSTVKFTQGCRMYFYNEGAGSELKYKILHGIYGLKFSFGYKMDLSDEEPEGDVEVEGRSYKELNLVIKDEAGAAVIAQYDAVTGNPIAGPYTIQDETGPGLFSKFFDVSKSGSGYYTVEVYDPEEADPIDIKQLYLHDELARLNISGVLKLEYGKLADANTPATKKELKISLTRANSKWKYLVVNKSGVDLDDYDIILRDRGTADTVYAVYTFTGNPDGEDGQPGPDEENSVGGYETLVFESTEKIPFYEDSKTKLELKVIENGDAVDDGGTILNSNLPNPHPSVRVDESSKVLVYI